MEKTNELTAAIAAKYFGAKFIYNGSAGVVRTMGGIEWTHNLIDYPKTDTFRTDKCKLILHNMENISIEDAVEVGRLIGFANGQTGWGKWYCKTGFPHNCALSATTQNAVTDFLRSRSYDVDGGVAAGWAIDSETLKTD